jgi:hypothetical protein
MTYQLWIDTLIFVTPSIVGHESTYVQQTNYHCNLTKEQVAYLFDLTQD